MTVPTQPAASERKCHFKLAGSVPCWQGPEGGMHTATRPHHPFQPAPLADDAREDWTLTCGHPPAIFGRSVESNYQFCHLCEARSRLRDALEMERRYRGEVDALRHDIEAVLDEHADCARTECVLYEQIRARLADGGAQ